MPTSGFVASARIGCPFCPRPARPVAWQENQKNRDGQKTHDHRTLEDEAD